MRIIGHVDRCDEHFIAGWITIPDTIETKLRLEFLLDEKVIGRCVADQFRQDLKDASIGDGQCAFSFQTPEFIPKRDISRIIVRLEISIVCLPIDTANPDGKSLTNLSETISRFGGLWIDRYDWLDRLAMKNRKGAISDDFWAVLFRFLPDCVVSV